MISYLDFILIARRINSPPPPTTLIIHQHPNSSIKRSNSFFIAALITALIQTQNYLESDGYKQQILFILEGVKSSGSKHMLSLRRT